jgi:outer membrane protein assembly complex protein YaeT
MGRKILFLFFSLALATHLAAQTAVDIPKPEEQAKAQSAVSKEQEKRARRTTAIEFRGQRAFTEKQLRSQLKEQITALDQEGLTAARADDLAFFLSLIYKKHGYTKVEVHYAIEAGDRLRLEIAEGPLLTLGTVTFEGNVKEPKDKLFDFAVGPTRERYSKLQRNLPFVEADMREGADLVHRLYLAEGFLDATVDPPRYTYRDEANQVDITIPIHEGRQYFFGNVRFTGQTIYDAETLRGQIIDLLKQPYTDARVADIPRRLQAYFKGRGYYAVKVAATSTPEASKDGKVPVQITVAPGPVYHFGDVTVNGLKSLRPSFVTKRFRGLSGKPYSPDALDERFRTLMQTGLFSILQIKPVPVDGDVLQLEISAEEAKSKQIGFSVGYGTYPGGIIGAEYRDRNFLGYGRPVTTSVEVSQRGYKGEIGYDDLFFLDSDFALKIRLGALTFDFDGYSKFEFGGRFEITRKITKQDEAGVIFSIRHVEVTSADIKPIFLGQTSYLVNTVGFTNTFDLRDSPLVTPRGLIIGNTMDLALNAFGSQIEFVRTTARVGYYLPFAPKALTPGVVEDQTGKPLQRWFRQSSLAFGARLGVIHSLTTSGSGEAVEIPIDERFFNGGNSTVRSFGERELGPADRKGHPIGGEFSTVFNAEYTFPILGELQGALFADAGNLLPSSEEPGLDDMRYGVGVGLRYKLPIGPIRIDYGYNPDRRRNEDFGAFHFSFGFAF